MRRSREITISTPSATGSAPPESPVPEPRATHGTSASKAGGDDLANLFGGAGEHRRDRHLAVVQQPVGAIGRELVLVSQHELATADLLQAGDQRGRA